MQDRAGSGKRWVSDLYAAVDHAGWAGVYAMTLTVIGFLLGGYGHGVITPFWIGVTGLFLWPIAGMAIRWAQRPLGKGVFVGAMSLSYVVTTVVWIGSGDSEYMGRVWARMGWFVILFIGLYCAGQAVLLRVFAKRAL